MPTPRAKVSGGNFSAKIFAVNNSLEHNATIVYRSIFLGETHQLITSRSNWEAQCYDTAMEDLALGSIISAFAEEPDLVIFWSDVHQAEAVMSLARRLKAVSSQTRTFVFGRATTFIPQYFERPPFDFVHIDGDREATLEDVLDLRV